MFIIFLTVFTLFGGTRWYKMINLQCSLSSLSTVFREHRPRVVDFVGYAAMIKRTVQKFRSAAYSNFNLEIEFINLSTDLIIDRRCLTFCRG